MTLCCLRRPFFPQCVQRAGSWWIWDKNETALKQCKIAQCTFILHNPQKSQSSKWPIKHVYAQNRCTCRRNGSNLDAVLLSAPAEARCSDAISMLHLFCPPLSETTLQSPEWQKPTRPWPSSSPSPQTVSTSSCATRLSARSTSLASTPGRKGSSASRWEPSESRVQTVCVFVCRWTFARSLLPSFGSVCCAVTYYVLLDTFF